MRDPQRLFRVYEINPSRVYKQGAEIFIFTKSDKSSECFVMLSRLISPSDPHLDHACDFHHREGRSERADIESERLGDGRRVEWVRAEERVDPLLGLVCEGVVCLWRDFRGRSCDDRHVLGEDICGTRDELGLSVADERIGSGTRLPGDVSGDREDVASEVEGESRGDERAGFFARLGHEDSARHACHDLVADREVEGIRSGPERKGGHESSASCEDALEEIAVLRGVASVDPRAEYGDGVSATRECELVGECIYSVGSARDDPIVCGDEVSDDPFECVARIGGAFS